MVEQKIRIQENGYFRGRIEEVFDWNTFRIFDALDGTELGRGHLRLADEGFIDGPYIKSGYLFFDIKTGITDFNFQLIYTKVNEVRISYVGYGTD